MGVALDPEKNTMSLAIHNIPLENLEDVLINISQPGWRQNIIDGVNGAIAAKDLGVCSTERRFRIKP